MKKILFTSIFALSFLFMGVTADAMMRTNFSQRVSFSSQFNRPQTLRPGMFSKRVAELQKKLKELGFYNGRIDFKYGPATIAAVKKFQKMKGLRPDGIAGAKTFAALASSFSFSSTSGVKPYKPINDVRPYKPVEGIKPFKPIEWTKPYKPVKPVVCTQEYDPVCGKITSPHIGESPTFRTFPNMCALRQAGEQVTFAYKGECNTTRPVDAHTPFVRTDGVSRITNHSAVLHGFVNTNRIPLPGIAYFVWGTDRNLVNSVDGYNHNYADTVTYGDRLQKAYVDNSFTGQGGIHLTANNLRSNSGYFYRACLSYSLNDAETNAVCGKIKEFKTSDILPNTENPCLKIEADYFGARGSANVPYQIGSTSKQIGEFNISNICDKDIVISNIYFDVASSLNKAPFRHMSVDVEGTPYHIDITDYTVSTHQLAGYGNDLSFESRFPANGFVIEAHEDKSIDVDADIFGTYSSITGEPYDSAFAIAIDDVKYKYNGRDFGFISEPSVWSRLIVVKND